MVLWFNNRRSIFNECLTNVGSFFTIAQNDDSTKKKEKEEIFMAMVVYITVVDR